MRITRIYLRNYRVFEQELNLEIPSGLVGIYGVNGGGKSSLIESILWSLYGKSRTKNEEIRTSGVLADCITELEFEHEGHLYLVRRTISGINTTVKAEAFVNGSQVAAGVNDVKRYVHSVLGMDDAAFRASVFAEQKQVAAFSQKTPRDRRDLVLKLLGITPLDAARDRARSDARLALASVEKLRGLLPDLDALRSEVELGAALAETAVHDAESEATAAETAAGRATAAEEAFARLDEIRVEHDALLREGKAARGELDQSAARIKDLEAELAALSTAAAELEAAQAAAADLDGAESELQLVEAAANALAARAELGDPVDVPEPDEAALEGLRAAADKERSELDAVAGELRAEQARVVAAAAQLEKSATLSADEPCPVCEQELGEALPRLREHRERDLAGATARVEELQARQRELSAAVSTSAAEVQAATKAVRDARLAHQAAEQTRGRIAAADAAVAAALDALVPIGRSGADLSPEEVARLRKRVARARAATATANQLLGRLQRRPDAEAQLAAERERHAAADAKRTILLEKIRALDFDADRLAALRTARDEARGAAASQVQRRDAARRLADEAKYKAASANERLLAAEAQHAALAAETETARHLGRLGELLNLFRTNVVSTVGPRLSIQAAELFSEFTDAEYDLLQVDPETYEIQILDAGRIFGMDRFSGSETDLANLALRIAISEHVRFQSGGAVGLLVLDEVFGPLDDDRKERMLLALERLRARFGQVLVVTHDHEIKEQLPSAIEVVKLPGRRATAHVVGI